MHINFLSKTKKIVIIIFSLFIAGCLTSINNNSESLELEKLESPGLTKNDNPSIEANAPLSKELLFEVLTAELALKTNDLDIAIDKFLNMAEKYSSPQLAAKAAYWSLHNNTFDKAKHASNLWLNLEPEQLSANQISARFFLARSALELDQLDEALQQYYKIVTDSPSSTIYNRIAAEMSRSSKRDKITQLYQDLIDKVGANDKNQVGLSLLASQLNNQELAKNAIIRALDINPANETAALVNLGHLYENQTDEQIIQYSQDFLSANSDANRFRMEYAHFLSRKSYRKKAIKQFKYIETNDHRQSMVARLNIIALAMEERKFKLADKTLAKILHNDPSNSRYIYFRCQAQRELRNYKMAKELCHEITFGDYYFPAQLELANILVKSDDLKTAINHLKAVPASGKEELIRIHLLHYQILFDEKQTNQALSVLNNALKEFKDDTSLLYARGLVLSELGKINEHETDMRRVIKLEPDNAHAYNALGYTLADLTTRYDEALKLISKANTLRPDDAYILDSLGWVHFKLNNMDKAKQHLEKAFRLNKDAEIAAHLGELYWTLGDKKKAKEIWRESQRLHPDNRSLKETLERFL